MNSILIVGASRGIGLELARQYLEAGWIVHATTRTPEQPGALGDLSGDLRLYGFDVRDHPAGLVESVGQLEVVVHNAGVGRGTPREEMMEVNAEAPIQLVEALLGAGAVVEGGNVVIMTSQMGARKGGSGTLGDYGDSKAALNDEFRARADRWAAAGINAIVVHPGWVRTDMGGTSAPLSVEESVQGIRTLIDEMGPYQHGGFWTWDGRPHPW